ncbi:DUF1028 domain-containing protein [Alteribacillus bidgolensis]|uniref:Uncharacterized conserved protein, Ntn-hydrolase superfamily n=1 Tax=Alteribacillus bidgolensis TaxID=930129 RepID=A0A1G8IE66_9BACI|nr:DUF1028 domain-containing protein [Alteribacillus bidgolensis]SDI17142.1 Uncharacterized conserved protein, Ntn-hydrolase superfamily [Alteribacillus bidgolensis]
MDITSTFSVAGRCERTGQLGLIVTSSSPAVGARCAHIKHKTGIVLSQNVTDPRLATIGLMVMEQGFTANEAVKTMKAASEYLQYRQLAAVDTKGNSSVFTGEQALGTNGEFAAPNVACVGNLLSDEMIPKAMGEYYLAHSDLNLEDRLYGAMEKGFQMGGEMDDERSIALLTYTDEPFPFIDLRVDYSLDPLSDLKQILEVYKPQANDYKVRALNPTQAPSYGVKGDE